MICEALSDRMPAVARGDVEWDDEERVHLAQCDECRLEWAVVAPMARAAAAVVDPVVDLDRVANNVVTRLQGGGRVLAFRPPRRWTRVAAGLAAAAAVAIAFTWGRPDVPVGDTAIGVPTRAPTAIPELDALLEAELEVVLASLGPDVSPDNGLLEGGGIPRLGDLTDAELELLLETVES